MSKLERLKWFMIGAIFVVLSLSLTANYILVTQSGIGYNSEQQALMDKLVAEVQ